MLFVFLSLALAVTGYAVVPTAEQTRAVLNRLSQEADDFEANAHRVVGVETLKQTQPEGTRFGLSQRGVETKLPGVSHEIVSEYGFISSDEPGGSLKEVRAVQMVDGLQWKRGKKELKDLANGIAVQDARNRAKSLERFEDYGLRGFLSDTGQLILLFARRGIEKYEFTFDRQYIDPTGPVWIYRYRQIDGPQAFTIYGGKEPVRQRLTGEVWLSAGDGLPVRVTLNSDHVRKESTVRDITAVQYQMSEWGFVLPWRIEHRQFVDQELFVLDEFTYDRFKVVLPGKRR